LHLYDEQRDWHTPPLKLGTPKLFDLITDPKEEYTQTFIENTWAITPMTKLMAEFEASVKRFPLIAPGTPDPYSPPK
jgi:arylsulfatase